MTRRACRVATVVLVAVAAAGCAGESGKFGGGGTSRSAAPATTTAGSSTAPATRTLAELAERPCLALAEEDAAALGVFIDGSETDYGGKGCQWGLRGGLVNFQPSTSADLTADPSYQHLTPQQVSGHTALAGMADRGGSCTLIVSVGADQSFTIIVAPLGEGASGPDVCTLATSTATAIVGRLG